jgi:hypothetical protein
MASIFASRVASVIARWSGWSVKSRPEWTTYYATFRVELVVVVVLWV